MLAIAVSVGLAIEFDYWFWPIKLFKGRDDVPPPGPHRPDSTMKLTFEDLR
jgi:hypothetical protein